VSGTVLAGDNILITIARDKAAEIEVRKRESSLEEMRARSLDMPPTRGFINSMKSSVNSGNPAVIAEIKKASPSRGLIREAFAPADIAASYQLGGASCLSVLTDEKYFRGCDDYLRVAREACSLPVLRKDFTIDEFQVWETRQLGADCILLIVAVLGDSRLGEFASLATEIGLDVLVEVHDEAELARAAELKLTMIGINNRDLTNFTTSLDTTIDLLPAVPHDCLVVTESGIHSREDVERLCLSGVHAFLVGEAFMSAVDPGKRLAEMFFQG
jgi:indole-3-glycerol phosphate synthase